MSVAGPAKRAGRVLGRSPDDVQPYIDLLKDNWYDTIESLKGANVPDLVQLGLPQRFVKELLLAVDGDSGHSRDDDRVQGKDNRSWDSSSWKNDRRDDRQDYRLAYDDHRDDWRGGGNSSSKGRSYDDRNDWYDRGDRGKSKGKSKDGKGKEGKGNDGKGKKGGDGSGCFICGREGHFARECPDKDDEQRRKGDGKGRDTGGKGSREEYEHVHKIVLETEEVDPAFGFAGGVIGKGGKNMKHIREATGAWVSLRGIGSNSIDPATNAENDEPLHVMVRARTKESMEEAINITNDLIDSVFEQYDEWLRDDTRAEDGKGKGKGQDSECYSCGQSGHIAKHCPDNPKGKGKDSKGSKGKGKKGKSKGKGKRHSESRDSADGGDNNDDEPPQKRARTSEWSDEYVGDDSAPGGEDYDEALDLLE